MTVPLKPHSESPATPTAGPRNSMTAAVRKSSWKIWRGFDTDLNRDGSSMSTDLVFISYSHRDKRWFDILDIYLRPFNRDGSIKSWSDKEIEPGLEWFEAINSATTAAKIAVLLVTPAFIASDFMNLPRFGGHGNSK
jgi:hypothetical protein